jgi:hypothetical protein
MKKLIILILITLFIACSDYTETSTLTHVNAMVLNRRTYYVSHVRGTGGTTYYQVYLFNGVESKWYDTDEEVYRKLRPRDTVTSYVLTIIKTKNK